MGYKQTVINGIHKLVRVSGIEESIAACHTSLKREIDTYGNKLIRSDRKTVSDLAKRMDRLEEVISDTVRKEFREASEGAGAICQRGGYVDKGTQILMELAYREAAQRGVIMPFGDVEFRNYSQTGEDGILWYLFSLLGTTNKIAVEMCAGVGYECNSANLIINHGWHGLLFDGDPDNIRKGTEFFANNPDTRILPPNMIEAWITADNVNDLIAASGARAEIDLFSLDVDGVDYWIWKAIDTISPRVVVLEFQAAWRDTASVTVPYASDFVAKWCLADKASGAHAQYAGASLPAFVKLAKEKGYRLVGANSLGYNAFFVRNDVGTDLLPAREPATCFTHPVGEYAHHIARQVLEGLDWEEV